MLRSTKVRATISTENNHSPFQSSELILNITACLLSTVGAMAFLNESNLKNLSDRK